jgi:chromosome segregation ATPase
VQCRSTKLNCEETVLRQREVHRGELQQLRSALESARGGQDVLTEELQSQLAGATEIGQRFELTKRLLREKSDEVETLSGHVTQFAAELQRAAELLGDRDEAIRRLEAERDGLAARQRMGGAQVIAEVNDVKRLRAGGYIFVGDGCWEVVFDLWIDCGQGQFVY